jgi:predicted transcriptional regulator of viral defense system
MPRNSRKNEKALRAVARVQGGYFTAAQARSVGYSYRQQHYHRECGNWLLIERGIYRYPDFPASDHEDLIRWSLWSRNRKGQAQAVVSHASALDIHGLSDVMPGRVHLTVPPGFRKRPRGRCNLHRGRLEAAGAEEREGFRVTTPLRTILDMAAANLSLDHLAAAIRDAVRKGLVRRAHLLEVKGPSRVRERLLEALLAASTEPASGSRPRTGARP